ncbi:LOW QUALITY PROTEIN: thymus-specific serine protease [Manduca sexta]|uniref:LOW QUALITY PROTEIN: thymus-specific serine protease n=1 Tax=Manduca sexta TaxID=7130 RepID=UPI00188FC5C9|nr:LOW QUALITY PROTEIN: thymus-specific serine protease [Manduca sexta]
MYFAFLNTFFLLCLHFADSLAPFSLGNGYRYLSKEVNSMVANFDKSTIETKWLQQPLDHFNKTDDRMWNMRYFERLDKWRPKGPVYLFINGEDEATQAFLQTGIMYELAKETKGAMYLSEHRYYGKSIPFDDLSTENLKYLNSKQALADVAKLIEEIKLLPQFKSSKVVVVGGSYAGNLATWMELLYPQLIDAAIASSAPVVAKKDFYEYLENVSEDFEQHGTPNCLDKIAEIFKRYDELFKSPDGIAKLKAEEHICDKTDMNKNENKQIFFLDKSSEFMYTAQYGNPKRFKSHCEDLISTSAINSSKDEVLWNAKNDCFDYDFDEMIKSMKEIDWLMSWTYQTCTEFSYFPTSSSDKQPFTKNIRMDLFYKMCSSLYGPTFNEQRIEEGVKNTNELFGGLKPNVSNVVFVNGDLDPYHKLGVLEDVSYDAPAKVIPRASHCRDLFSNRPGDHQELKEARNYIKYLVKKWIGAGDYIIKRE